MNQKIKAIADGWIELESDPGLFTLLIEDFGVQGVEVEEIYDLQTLLSGQVYGFIFLFKWLEGGRRSRRAKFELGLGVPVTDEAVVNSMFFAHQKVQNSCATHAILSILMNSEIIELGPILSDFKSFTKDMSPEGKGLALNNLANLCLAHNKHARPDAIRDFDDDSEKGGSVTATTSSTSALNTKWQETFHFASFLPINGHLYEMDSLKQYPIDHGLIPDGLEWQQYFQQLISDRIATASEHSSHEIRYNLMALVPCKIDKYNEKLKFLTFNHDQLVVALRTLVVAVDPDVFRTLFQISSFSHRKKLSDLEIIQAGEYLLMIDNETSSTAADETGETKNAADASAEYVAEVECASNSSSSNLFQTYVVDDFEIEDVEPKLSPPRRTTTADEAPDFVELSAQSCSNSSKKNVSALRKIVRIRFVVSSVQDCEYYTLKDVISCVRSLDEEIKKYKRLLAEEHARRCQYDIDDQHRTHNYDDFTRTFLSSMVAHGVLEVKDDAKNGKVKKSVSAATSQKQKPPVLQQQRNQTSKKIKLSK